MIYDEDLERLLYGFNIVSKSVYSRFPEILLTTDDLMIYVLVEGTVTGGFKLILEITDYINNIWETSIDIEVYKWASKDWIKCKGYYQEDCTQWAQNYELEAGTGRWLRKFDYWQVHFNFKA